MKGLLNSMTPGVKPMGPKPMAKGPTMATVRAAPQMKAPKGAPKRPSGQFQGQRESAGKINGGGMGSAQAPMSHSQFEKLGHSK